MTAVVSQSSSVYGATICQWVCRSLGTKWSRRAVCALFPLRTQAHEAVIKLRDNLRMEQRMLLEFAMSVFREVFRPVQTATLLVKCFPAVPDALGIASVLGTELGETDMSQARQLTMQLGGYLGEWS